MSNICDGSEQENSKSDLDDALDAIQNLMALVDSPAGRYRLQSDFADGCRAWASRVLKKHGRNTPGYIP